MKHNQQGSSAVAAIIIIVLLAVAGGAYYYYAQNNSDDAMMEGEDNMMNDEMMSDEEGAMMDDEGSMMNDGDTMMDNTEPLSFTGMLLAGSQAPLIDFNQADYEKAVASGKLAVLYFYANWCPVCAEETAQALYPAFNELDNPAVAGFRVNFNDNQTDDNETALAKEFGVAYQHTKVLVKDGERVLKSPESWDKERYFDEIAKAL